MKAIKIFLITSAILIIVAMGVVGYVWFKIQQNISSDTAFTPSDQTPIANTIPEEGIKIDTSSLTDDQKALAEKVGINLDEVVITQEMVSCAEQKLGAERAQEIADGDSPTALESVSLLGCL